MIYNQIKTDALKARKEAIKDKSKKPLSNVLTSLIGDLDSKAKDLKLDTLSDEETFKILRYWSKQMQKLTEMDNIELDVIKASKISKAIYDSYLPQVMTLNEMRAILDLHKFDGIGSMMRFFKTYHKDTYSNAQLVTLFNNEYKV